MFEFHLLLDQIISFCGRPCIGTHNYIWEFHKIIGFLVFQPQNVRNMMKHPTMIFKNHFKQVGISPITSVHHITQYTHTDIQEELCYRLFFLIRNIFCKSVIIEVYRPKFEYVLEIDQCNEMIQKISSNRMS